MRPHPHPPSLGGPPSTQRLAGGAAEQFDAAAAILGSDHPLVKVLRAVRIAIDQTLAIAAVQAAGVGLLLTGHPWGLELLGAGIVVQAPLGLRLLVLIETRHDLCRDLILEDRCPAGSWYWRASGADLPHPLIASGWRNPSMSWSRSPCVHSRACRPRVRSSTCASCVRSSESCAKSLPSSEPRRTSSARSAATDRRASGPSPTRARTAATIPASRRCARGSQAACARASAA